MSLFEYMEEHEQIKNLHDRINNLKTIEKAHQKFNGELREEVKEFISFYLKNAGNLVADVGYIPLTKDEYNLEINKGAYCCGVDHHQ